MQFFCLDGYIVEDVHALYIAITDIFCVIG